MVALRLFSMLIAVAVAMPAAANIFPYEQVGVEGDNNIIDVNLGSCDTLFQDGGDSFGCWDDRGSLCSLAPDSFCDVANVPLGRCLAGSGSPNVAGNNCIWPARKKI